MYILNYFAPLMSRECLRKIEIMIMIMISYNVLQKRSISQKYKKCSPGKYAMLLYVAVSIRWISIRFNFVWSCYSRSQQFTQLLQGPKIYSATPGANNLLSYSRGQQFTQLLQGPTIYSATPGANNLQFTIYLK